METLRTSAPTISSHRGTLSGYTLVELLVVIALIGVISAIALPSIGGYFKLSLNSASRELASVLKEAYNSAIITGKAHRLVYDLKEHSYWVEVGPQGLLLDTEETRERDRTRRRFSKGSDEKQSSGFSLSRSVTRKKLSLPRGVEFEDVLTEASREPLKEGVAYTHVFGHGLAESTIVHLKDSQDHHISLVVQPLGGKTRLVERYLTREEADAL